MEQQLKDLAAKTGEQENQLADARRDLSTARASLAAARSAINAFHAGRLTDAVSLYDEALAADPDNAYLQNLRAYALFRLGRIEAAIESQKQSLKSDPNYAWGYFDLARFLCSASPARVDEARQATERAIALRPDMRGIMQSDGEFQRVCRRKLP
jgi:tetratricopeptide (TPR) repeat protein